MTSAAAVSEAAEKVIKQDSHRLIVAALPGCANLSLVAAPRFDAADSPGVILDRSGQWLAADLGWRWVKSRQEAEVRARRQVRRLRLHPSKWNRRGVATWAFTWVTVVDQDLEAWRTARPERSVLAGPALPVRRGIVNGTLLINVEPALDEIECSGLPTPFPDAPGDGPGRVRRRVPAAGAAGAGPVPGPVPGGVGPAGLVAGHGQLRKPSNGRWPVATGPRPRSWCAGTWNARLAGSTGVRKKLGELLGWFHIRGSCGAGC